MDNDDDYDDLMEITKVMLMAMMLIIIIIKKSFCNRSETETTLRQSVCACVVTAANALHPRQQDAVNSLLLRQPRLRPSSATRPDPTPHSSSSVASASLDHISGHLTFGCYSRPLPLLRKYHKRD